MKPFFCSDQALIVSLLLPLPTITAKGLGNELILFRENSRKLFISCGDKLGINSAWVCQYPTKTNP